VAYVRHLRNADAMFGMLRSALQERSRPGMLCIFGDHIPIMPEVYRRLGEPDGTTDYLVWHAARQGQAGARAVAADVSQLAGIALVHGALRHPGSCAGPMA